MSHQTYDLAFRTLVNKAPQLLIPLINEIFNTKYNDSVIPVILNNELPKVKDDGELDVIITDLICCINTRKYHIECQSTVNSNMIIRMFEYDANIALKDSYFVNDDNLRLVVPFPDPAILYLRSNHTIPKEYTIEVVTSGGSVTYNIPVLDITKYSTTDIFDKNILFLLPFFLFQYENRFKKADQDSLDLQSIISDYKYVLRTLCSMRELGEIESYVCSTLVDMLYSVASALTAKYTHLRKELFTMVKDEHFSLHFTTLYEQGLEKGIEKGIEQGRAEGRAEGIEKGIETTYHSLVTRLLSQGKSKIEVSDILGISLADVERFSSNM